MRIYLAARYSRREELCGYREQLRTLGHEVCAVWLNGKHQIGRDGNPIGDHGETLVESDGGDAVEAALLRQKFAAEDFRDVAMCDLLIAFTEPTDTTAKRGGRHVEMGIALGMMKRVWVVGHRENLFCWLEDVRFFPDFADAFGCLAQ